MLTYQIKVTFPEYCSKTHFWKQKKDPWSTEAFTFSQIPLVGLQFCYKIDDQNSCDQTVMKYNIGRNLAPIKPFVWWMLANNDTFAVYSWSIANNFVIDG